MTSFAMCVQGVWENCPIRKNDSFRAFEEVFREAQARDVDMVLLGECRPREKAFQ